MKIWPNCKVDKVENSKDWKLDKIKNSIKMNVRQNWKLDETENSQKFEKFEKVKLRWNWKLKQIEKTMKLKFNEIECSTKLKKFSNFWFCPI